jgi:predicted neuraminidase
VRSGITRLLQVALIASALPALVRMRQWRAPEFVLSPPVRLESTPFYEEEFLPGTATAFVHGSTLAELANGDLLAAWYGGSDEMQGDVAIFAARRDARTGRWSLPRAIEDRRSAESALGISVKSVGNPVLFSDGRSVWLFYVAIPFGGWSTGTVCLKTSSDGERWLPARRLLTSPLLDIGMLVRSRPLPYRDGGVALPVYCQLARKWSAIVRLDRKAAVIDEARIEDRRPLIQPWIVPVSPDRAVAFLRWSSRMPGSVTMAAATEGGMRWSSVFGTSLVNRDAAVAAERLSDGSLIVIYNNTAWDRRDLSIARSADGGRSWSKPRPLERDTTPDWNVRREYSYPFLYRARNGRIHLLYTWQRSKIRHLVFNDEWLMAQVR